MVDGTLVADQPHGLALPSTLRLSKPRLSGRCPESCTGATIARMISETVVRKIVTTHFVFTEVRSLSGVHNSPTKRTTMPHLARPAHLPSPFFADFKAGT